MPCAARRCGPRSTSWRRSSSGLRCPRRAGTSIIPPRPRTARPIPGGPDVAGSTGAGLARSRPAARAATVRNPVGNCSGSLLTWWGQACTRLALVSLSAHRMPKKSEPPTAQPSLSPDEMQSLRAFVQFALGDEHLTSWEENFLNSLKHRLYQQAMWLTGKQQAIVRQIKDKLHYDHPDDPLPPIDPDGIEENIDPDGWPIPRQPVRAFEDDDELFDWLRDA